MASTQSISMPRAPRMTSASNNNNNRHLLKLDDTIPQKKQQHIPHKHDNKHTTFNPRLGAMSPESLDCDSSDDHEENSASEDESDEDEDEADDTDPADVHPPSSTGDEQAQAGGHAVAGISKEAKQGKSTAYDSDSDIAEQEDEDEENFDINDDDDDYDGVDKMSVTSDGSDAFEAEVENEILAAGEGGIDWDNEETYGYAAINEYEVTNPYVDSDVGYLGFSYYDYEFDTEGQSAVTTPVVQGLDAVVEPKPLSPRMSWSMSGTSSSTRSEHSESADAASRRASLETGETGLSQFTLSNGNDTDDEDFPPPQVSSPIAKFSTKTPMRISSSPQSRLITASTPRKVGLKRPTSGKIKLDPKKAIAYSVDGPGVMKFMTPKGSLLKWVDMRHFDSDTDDSTPDSPTMIDIDIALADGNTRSGAAITDTVHGVMFRQHHCDPTLWVSAFVDPEPPTMVEFARVASMNASSRQRFSSLFDNENAPRGDVDAYEFLAEGAASDLIDFDGGVGSEDTVEGSQTVSVSSSDPPQADVVMMDAPSSWSSNSSTSTLRHGRRSKVKHAAGKDPRSSTPPNEDHFAAMEITSSSPLKRRATANDGVGAGSLSPTSKKKRHVVIG